MAVFRTSALAKGRRAASLFYEFFLDALLPRPPEIKTLESKEAAHFAAIIVAPDPKRNLFSFLPYKNKHVQNLVWEIKYRGNPKLTKLGAEIIYDGLIPELEEKRMWENFSDPILVPLPLSKERQRERGFNQVERLAEDLVSIDGNVHFSYDTKLLRKIRNTKSQTRAESREERLQNLKDCFSVPDPARVNGRNIILLDDVSTTGATLDEASRALLEAGAKSVFRVTLAH